jgi:superfamily II DNA or RNA helicase
MENMVFSPGDLVRARGREWVVLPAPADGLLRVRPLSGSDEDAQVIVPSLESQPIKPARFAPPTLDRLDTQEGAQLLADALRLSLRRGAGPFRSAAHLGVEPRAYQLVPLMMALKLSTARLLIADDVGIGKTIEAGLILREWLDRGTVDRFTVLCPPHLVDQWVTELAEKFDVDAVAVTSSRARSLERGLPTSQSLFEAYPFTVVSLDYIKADSRRDDFARACPPLVIVDEAHACAGNERGVHQRFELLQRLAADSTRHMLFLTATPHSGDSAAYNRLLGLVLPGLAQGPDGGDANARSNYSRFLARHFVQRRRPDIQEGWENHRVFARHDAAEAPYLLSGEFASFQEDVLDYCLSVTTRAGADQRTRRLAFWGTLALMRCVGSSPAAAISALTNRLGGLAEEEAIEPVVFDAEQGLLNDGDVEPATAIEDHEERATLEKLIHAAQALDSQRDRDPKVRKLLNQLAALLEAGAKPVIFCRFIATAEMLGEVMRAKWPKATVAVVTGTLPPDERRERVTALEDHPNRILVATDCLSEGINLQALFDAVVHYDLSWNPTRHQQREGRVDRFGQQAEVVRSVMMFGENSAIDGAVLDVIIRKAAEIQKATGVSVPMPEDQESVTAALMKAVLLRKGGSRMQMTFDFGPTAERFEITWRNTAEGAKASRARYAQGALKPEEVVPEWQKMRALNGGPREVGRFTDRALRRLGSPLQRNKGHFLLHCHGLPKTMRERLHLRGIKATRAINFEDDPSPGIMYVGRVHPIVATLSETLAEGAFDPIGIEGNALGRAGVWRTRAVTQMTTLLLLRLRFQLVTSGRGNRMLLAEEAIGIAFEGQNQSATREGLEALQLLEAEAGSNLEAQARTRHLENALSRLAGYETGISTLANARAKILSEDHLRLTEAAGGGATVKVSPVLPADVIGLYVLLPETN